MDWSRQVPSDHSPGKFYTVQLKDGIYSCSCAAWKNQRSPISHRTCKHLIRILGDHHERKRAPESFYGLTRVTSDSAPSTRRKKIKFMSYHTYNPESYEPMSIQGWYYSIKLDGALGRWISSDGKLVTKSGRVLHPPARITDQLPREVDLDGEIYSPNKNAVRKAILSDKWDDTVEFVVYDMFNEVLPFQERWNRVEHLHHTYKFKMVKQYKLDGGEDNWAKVTQHVVDQKEEGLVLRDPSGMYEAGKRSWTTLKWKPISHGQAIIVSIRPKKIGVTLTIQEDGVSHTFNLYARNNSSKKSYQVGDKVDFIYSGRDEKDNPEFARIFTTSVPA